MNQFLKISLDNKLKISLVRVSLGLIYIWFGALKFFPDLSPAESIARATIQFLTMDLIPLNIGYLILAIWEIGIGFLLVFNIYKKQVVIIAIIHLVFTFTPFFAFTDSTFDETPFSFTLLGQYIFKNIVLISSLLLIYPTTKNNNATVLDCE
jgi:uncharacterized membrane protein YkgB